MILNELSDSEGPKNKKSAIIETKYLIHSSEIKSEMVYLYWYGFLSDKKFHILLFQIIILVTELTIFLLVSVMVV